MLKNSNDFHQWKANQRENVIRRQSHDCYNTKSYEIVLLISLPMKINFIFSSVNFRLLDSVFKTTKLCQSDTRSFMLSHYFDANVDL
jgi:hypothetical protein